MRTESIITGGSSSRFGLKLVLVDLILISRILDLSVYQHIIIFFDHIPLERVVANVSKAADLAIWREPADRSTVLIGLKLPARALLA